MDELKPTKKYIPQAQMKSILLNAPKDANLGEIVKILANKGYIMEGYNDQGFRQYTPTDARLEQSRGGLDTKLGDITKNIIPSGERALKGIGQAIAHPLETVKNLGETVVGGASNLGRALGTGANVGKPQTPEEEKANMVGQFFKDRYGSLDSAKKTFINDPVGFMLDASVVLGGAGTALKTAGKAGEIGALETAGNIASKAGQIVDPLATTAKVATKVAGKAKDAAKFVAGETFGTTTGVGPEVLAEAFRNPSEQFTQALRGKVDKVDLVNSAKSALQSLKDTRASEYQAKLAEIAKQKESLDISPIVSKLDTELSKFGITKTDDGMLDFSRSTISSAEGTQDVQAVYNTLKEWGTKPGDRTPLGVDLLKRRLSDYYSDSGQARAFVEGLRSETASILEKQVPGYAEMTRGYTDATKFIDDVQKALSIGGKSGTESAINKLITGLKEDKEYRTAIIREIDKLTDTDLTGRIAGASLETLLPRGLTGKLFAGGAIGGGLAYAKVLVALLATLPAFSPRLMGEFLRAMGIVNNKIKPIVDTVVKVRKQIPLQNIERGAFEAGRLPNENIEE